MGALAGEKAPQAVVDIANNQLVKLGEDPVIVAAVKEQNSKNMSLEDIKAKDESWRNTPGLNDFMKSIMETQCADHLRKIQGIPALLFGNFCHGQSGRQCCPNR